MAFRAFDEWQDLSATEPPRLAAAVSTMPEPAFTPIELSVIALARVDGPATVRRRTWLTRLAKAMFGIGLPNPLADPRLEALRRFAIVARDHRGDPPQAEIDRFLAAGFTALAAITLSSLAD